MIEIRKGTADDLEGFIQLLRQVKEAMDNPQWFYLDSPEEVREMFADGTMDLWVAVDGERLAGAFDALYPGLQSFNYGYAVGMAQEDLLKVVNMDTAAVHPDYRGQGLQRRLMACAEKNWHPVESTFSCAPSTRTTATACKMSSPRAIRLCRLGPCMARFDTF